jgi:hypothetical protein
MKVDNAYHAGRGDESMQQQQQVQPRVSKAADGVKQTAETLLVGVVLAVLAAATVFMMVELLK